MTEVNRIANVADALLELTYSEMMELAQSLCDTADGDVDFSIASKKCVSDLLNSWAESYEVDNG